MKRYFTIIIAILAAIFAVSSCMVDENTNFNNTESANRRFAANMVDETAGNTLETFQSLISNGIEINEPGFQYSSEKNSNSGYFLIKWISDNCWEVSKAGNCRRWTMTVRYSKSARLKTDDIWTCSDVKAAYDEGNGYTATLLSVGDIEYYWEISYGINQITYTLTPKGKFSLETFLNGSALRKIYIEY